MISLEKHLLLWCLVLPIQMAGSWTLVRTCTSQIKESHSPNFILRTKKVGTADRSAVLEITGGRTVEPLGKTGMVK
jgi:hypothetical protein